MLLTIDDDYWLSVGSGVVQWLGHDDDVHSLVEDGERWDDAMVVTFNESCD